MNPKKTKITPTSSMKAARKKTTKGKNISPNSISSDNITKSHPITTTLNIGEEGGPKAQKTKKQYSKKHCSSKRLLLLNLNSV